MYLAQSANDSWSLHRAQVAAGRRRGSPRALVCAGPVIFGLNELPRRFATPTSVVRPVSGFHRLSVRTSELVPAHPRSSRGSVRGEVRPFVVCSYGVALCAYLLNHSPICAHLLRSGAKELARSATNQPGLLEEHQRACGESLLRHCTTICVRLKIIRSWWPSATVRPNIGVIKPLLPLYLFPHVRTKSEKACYFGRCLLSTTRVWLPLPRATERVNRSLQRVGGCDVASPVLQAPN